MNPSHCCGAAPPQATAKEVRALVDILCKYDSQQATGSAAALLEKVRLESDARAPQGREGGLVWTARGDGSLVSRSLRAQAAEQLQGLVCFMFEATASPDADIVAAAAATTKL